MKKAVAVLMVLCLMLSNTTALAGSTWKCPECRAENTENFCGDCGTKRPDWTCAGCNRKIVTKYCVYCGMPKVHSDGLYAMKAGDYDTAISCFLATRYGDYQTRLAAAYSAKGKQFATANNWDQAIIYLEKSCTEHLEALGQSGEIVATLPKDLRDTMLTLASCCLFSGDAALTENDWEAAYAYLDQGIGIMSRFTDESISDLTETCDLLSRNKLINWDRFFRRYAQQYEKMGMYEEAVNLYAKVSQGQSAMEAARQKQKLQEQYAKQFNLETMYGVNSSDGHYIGLYQMDQIHTGDYAEGQIFYPALRITNSDASQKAEIKLTAVYNGETYYWNYGNAISISPRDSWEPHLSSAALPTGGDFCAWYFNDVLVARIKYTVVEGESYFKASVVDKLKTEMDLCLWNASTNSVETAKLNQGILNNTDSQMKYAPRLTITNESRKDTEIVVSLSLNGQDAVIWKPDTVASNDLERYICTSAKHIEGVNACIWYINGIEVLRGEYTMVNLPEETAEPTAAPTNAPIQERTSSGALTCTL